MDGRTREQKHGGAAVDRLCRHIVQLGLEGAHFSDALAACCTGLNEAGVPVLRGYVTLRASHPEFGGIAHLWEREAGTDTQTFERVTQPPEVWLNSPLHYILSNDISELRQLLQAQDPEYDFAFFDDLRARGATDYIAFKVFFFKDDNRLASTPWSRLKAAS